MRLQRGTPAGPDSCDKCPRQLQASPSPGTALTLLCAVVTVTDSRVDSRAPEKDRNKSENNNCSYNCTNCRLLLPAGPRRFGFRPPPPPRRRSAMSAARAELAAWRFPACCRRPVLYMRSLPNPLRSSRMHERGRAFSGRHFKEPGHAMASHGIGNTGTRGEGRELSKGESPSRRGTKECLRAEAGRGPVRWTGGHERSPKAHKAPRLTCL